MDHRPAHKVPAVRKAIERVTAELNLLPPDSPAFTPIVMAVSTLKASRAPCPISGTPAPL